MRLACLGGGISACFGGFNVGSDFLTFKAIYTMLSFQSLRDLLNYYVKRFQRSGPGQSTIVSTS